MLETTSTKGTPARTPFHMSGAILITAPMSNPPALPPCAYKWLFEVYWLSTKYCPQSMKSLNVFFFLSNFLTVLKTFNSNTSTNSILKKWNAQPSFIRFLDGNKLNCVIHPHSESCTNIEYSYQGVYCTKNPIPKLVYPSWIDFQEFFHKFISDLKPVEGRTTTTVETYKLNFILTQLLKKLSMEGVYQPYTDWYTPMDRFLRFFWYIHFRFQNMSRLDVNQRWNIQTQFHMTELF